MTNPLDYIKYFDAIQNAWSNLRADVISHLIAALGLYLLAGMPCPSFTTSDFGSMLTSPPIESLRQAGLLVYLPVMLAAGIFIYGILLRAVGGCLSSVQFMLFPPRSQNWTTSRLVSDSDIETVALTLNRDDFTSADMQWRLSDLSLRYSMQPEMRPGSFILSVRQGRQHSLGYLRNGLVFLLGWITLYVVLPADGIGGTFVQGQFLSTVVLLLAFVLWARLRVLAMIRLLQGCEISTLAQMVRRDPELRLVVNRARRVYPDLRRRIRELRDEGRQGRRRPSLAAYARARLWGAKEVGDPYANLGRRGWPFRGTYEIGKRFAFDESRNQSYDRQWLSQYCAYCYYLVWERMQITSRVFRRLLGYLLTGAL